MDVEAVDRWMEAYRAAWISNVPSEVAALFTEDAVYAVSPFTEPWTGRDEIVRRWVAGIQQDVELTYEVPLRHRRPSDHSLARIHPERRGSGQGRVRRCPGASLRARRPLFRASRVVLPTRAPGVNLRPSPAATSRTARTCARGRSTRFGDRRTTSMTRASRSRSTASMGNRIPKVCTDRECSSRRPSLGSSPDRPRSPRARSLRVCGTSTMNGPNRSLRILSDVTGSLRHLARASPWGPGGIRTRDTRVKSPLL